LLILMKFFEIHGTLVVTTLDFIYNHEKKKVENMNYVSTRSTSTLKCVFLMAQCKNLGDLGL